MADEQVIETLRIDIKLDKNFNINDLKEMSASLKSLSKIQNSLPQSAGKSAFGLGSLSKINFAAMLSSASQLLKLGIKTGKTIQKIAQNGMDYNETLNLWTVAMRGHNKEATEFLKKMNDAYGISEQTLMNAQATFKNMIGSLGQISSEMAYNLSEGITQMALDYASLYNVSIEQAMTKFEAALAGQVRPIRTGTGLDITENTLFQFYKELGGEKTVRQLNRTEKQLLAILAVYKQMGASGALGDMAKTIEYAANQSRVFAETMSDIKDYAGLIFVHIAESKEAFTKINATLMVAADLIKAIAVSMGAIRYETNENNLSDALNDIAGEGKDANKEIEKLKSTLFSFDKFNVLGEASNEESLDISQSIIDAFKSYTGIAGELKMAAREQADIWLETLGYVKDSEGNLVLSAEQTQTIFENAKQILKVVVGIGATLLMLKTFSISWIGAVASLIAYIYATNKEFANSTNNLFLSLMPVVNLLSIALQLLNPIADILTPIVHFAGEILDLVVLICIPVAFVLELFVKILDTVIAVGKALFTWDWGSFGERMGTWSNWSSMDMVDSWTYVRNSKAGKISTPTNAFIDSSQLEASIARGTMVGMSTMSSDASAPIDIDVAIDGQNLFQIFRGVAQRNGYDVVKVR